MDASVNRYGAAGLFLPPLVLVLAMLLRLIGHRVELRRWWRSEPSSEAPRKSRSWQMAIGMIALSSLLFAWTRWHGADARPFGLVRFGALWIPGLAAGQVDRLLTAWWLHVSQQHLMSNIGPLWLALTFCERWLGLWRAIATVAAASAVAAGLATIALWLAPDIAYVAGASLFWSTATGAALFCAMPGATPTEAQRAGVLRAALALNLVLSSLGSGLSAASHCAGLACGLVGQRLIRAANARRAGVWLSLAHVVALTLGLVRAERTPAGFELAVTSRWASRARDVPAILQLAEAFARSPSDEERSLAQALARRVLALDPANVRARAVLR